MIKKTNNRPLKLIGYSYSLEEAVKARNDGNLLCLRLDTNYFCNLTCLYCYSYSKEKVEAPAMKLEDAKDILDQAAEMKARSIVYLGGGEPTLYPHFLELMEYSVSKNITPVIFTNGMLMDQPLAKKLFELGASVIVKFDGFEATQEKLTGKGTYSKIHQGLENLMAAGFADKKEDNTTRLGIAPCMCAINYPEIPDIWRFARNNNIFPDFEKMTVVGNATDDNSLNHEQIRDLTEKLKNIDLEEFGLEWESPYSSILAHSCYIYLAGCHITAFQGVALCPEMPPVANLKEKKLKEIINSYPFSNTRHIEKNIEGECKECDYLLQCFGGCRSKAFYEHNSLFASDPFCTLIKVKV